MNRSEFVNMFAMLTPREKRERIRTATEEELRYLEEYYGVGRFHRIRQLAETSTRGTGLESVTLESAKKNVVVIPGIMGSELAIGKNGGDPKLLWVDLNRLFSKGRLGDLRLNSDGSTPATEGNVVSAPGLLTMYFDELEQFMLPNYNVRHFAYDWRRDIRDVAKQLDSFLRSEFGSQPVHLIAHSMGGLVARALIGQRLAAGASRTSVLGEGGRLVMLGTPNMGTYEAFKILAGTQDAIQVLAVGLQFSSFFSDDFDQCLTEVRTLVHTFPSVYQMLPRPEALPRDAGVNFYDRNGYLRLGSSLVNGHFQRAKETHQLIDNSVIPEIMRIVAGCAQDETSAIGLKDASRISPDSVYTTSNEGDGMVPHSLTGLPDVPLYFVEGGHGDLTEQSEIMAAIDDLLAGDPDSVRLSSTPIIEAEPESARSTAVDPLHTRGITPERKTQRRRDAALDLFKVVSEHWQSMEDADDQRTPDEIRLIELILSGWLGRM